MSDPEVAVILCMRSENSKPSVESTEILANCGHKVWAAASSVTFGYDLEEKEHQVEYYCLPCGVIRMYKTKQIDAVPPAELVESLSSEMSPAEVADLKKGLGIT